MEVQVPIGPRRKGRAVDIFPYQHILWIMPRAATTSDTFNAVAERRRRDILIYLAPRERPVSDIVVALGLGQPSVSKHLRVLRDVGLVEVRRNGRQAFYRTNPEGIRPLHEWTARFERYWRRQLTRVKDRAEQQLSRTDVDKTHRRQP
jgi:DNA-binding transcriptional ArsR family regulator